MADSNQILLNNEHHQLLFVHGWSQIGVQQIQDRRRPPSGKIEKRAYMHNGLTDRQEFWYADAYWFSETDCCHLRKSKNG